MSCEIREPGQRYLHEGEHVARQKRVSGNFIGNLRERMHCFFLMDTSNVINVVGPSRTWPNHRDRFLIGMGLTPNILHI